MLLGLPKVLVVDDEENIQKLVQVNLIARGYQVLITSDGEDALKLAQLECPDLVLLDLKIPGMSGWNTLTALKANQKLQKTSVIIMTGAASPDDEAKACSMGAVGCLAKPFNIDELMRQVRLATGKQG